jgi:hypothetical protein
MYMLRLCHAKMMDKGTEIGNAKFDRPILVAGCHCNGQKALYVDKKCTTSLHS